MDPTKVDLEAPCPFGLPDPIDRSSYELLSIFLVNPIVNRKDVMLHKIFIGP